MKSLLIITKEAKLPMDLVMRISDLSSRMMSSKAMDMKGLQSLAEVKTDNLMWWRIILTNIGARDR